MRSFTHDFAFPSLVSLLMIACCQTTTPPPPNPANIPSPKSRIFGPGLHPRLVLPARYFFIQALKSNGEEYNTSAGHDAFALHVEGLEKPCRIHAELLDRKDGSYIARYRLYDMCHGLRISIQLKNGLHVAESPFVYSGKVLSADCACPERLQVWKEHASCPARIAQITRDLTQFQENSPINVRKYYQDLTRKFHPGAASFCLYAIRAQNLYRQCFGQHVGFKIFMDQILLFLLRRTFLPDSEFIVNLGDYPLSAKLGSSRPFKAPVFSWCGSRESYDIVMPTYDLVEASLELMNRVVLDMLSVQATKTPLWHDKIPRAFWRGRDARQERLNLVALARNHSHLIDAALTNFFFFRDQEAQYGPKVGAVDFFQFFQHKYQLNLDGTVAAYRFPYLLAGDGLVFKQESMYYEHFYQDLQPWKHYVPVKRDLSDLVEKLNWALENDEQALSIGRRGASYARNNLLPHHVFCYYTLLLESWARMVVVGQLVEDEEYELVEQPTSVMSECQCEKDQLGIKDEL